MDKTPCVRALQLILCEDGCRAPRTAECGPVPGGDCWGDGHVYSSCDDGESWCPAPDCRWYGKCLCLCHT